MNAPLDDKSLDEYLTRGSEVSRRYRELDGNTVPPELDRRVLAEARAAASKNQSGGRTWMRWSAPVALAASAVLVVSIIIESGVEQGETVAVTKPVGDARPAKETSAPKATAAPAEAPVEVFTGLVPDATFEPQAPPEAPASASNVRSRDQALARQSQEQSQRSGVVSSEADREEVQVTARRRPEVMMDSPVAVVVEQSAPVSPPAAPPADEASALEEAVVTGYRRPEQRRSSGPRDTIGRSSASGASVSAQEELLKRSVADPERWLEEIRQLRRDSKSRAADLEWERFRKEFPDYPVAEDDIAAKRP